MAVNPSDAPKGYVAVKYNPGDCAKCAFYYSSEGLCTRKDCFPWQRNDKQHAYFVKRPESVKQDSVPTIPLNISLRDFFAGCAISGCMNASEEVYKVPERAYIMADMMLAEREKSLKEGKVGNE